MAAFSLQSAHVGYQGDIVLGNLRSATSCDNCIWPKSDSGNVDVPYTLSSKYSDSEKKIILGAMLEFETLTCVKFVARTDQRNYIAIKPDDGCRSAIGMVGGEQEISLHRSGCLKKGITQHELNHALGFYHEQARTDRDEYVTIVTENINPDDLKHFDIVPTKNLGMKYDYESVMHYSSTAFSNKPQQATIVPRFNTSSTIGQRYGLSRLDVGKINVLYGCDVCSTLLPTPKGTVSSANYPSNYQDNTSCVWLIRTPSQRVLLEFEDFDVQSSPDCDSDYVKVYGGASRTAPVLLEKACGGIIPPPLMSSSNLMLLEFVSDGEVTGRGFKASYGTVQCGNTFHQPSGTFTSPGFPEDYLPLLECIWLITAPEGFMITLRINQLNVEYSVYCRLDYLSVFDGDGPSAPLIGTYCGSRENIVGTSSGTSMFILFHSDHSEQMSGFEASYQFGRFI
ncbi:embryonic protein UVS.2-like [Spea bombifrons]|uniref:embryonic protein UVS.2-like n=1 Tax=Spea bombifrons TaxID=233779 RepID=UPI00234B4B08|nr:embryonic protein UVS.2-like [Spea bombifrons]